VIRRSERRFALAEGQQVSGVAALPEGPRTDTTVVLAHGAGTDMTNPQLVAIADALAEAGFATLRFNFPYKERRGRAPDPAAVLEGCYRAVLEQVRQDPRCARAPGDRRALDGRPWPRTWPRRGSDRWPALSRLPVAPGRPTRAPAYCAPRPHHRADAVPHRNTRRLVPAGSLAAGVGALPGATLHLIEDGDRCAVRVRSGRDAAAVRREIVGASVDWLHRRRRHRCRSV
jgi:hypothetical protein